MPIDAPIHTNQANLPRVLGAGLPVLLVFWRRDCQPCDQLMPVLDRLARERSGRALVVKINVAEEAQVAGRYGVNAIPTIIFTKDGQETGRITGAASEQELGLWAEYLISGGAHPGPASGPSVPFESSTGNGHSKETAQARPTAGANGSTGPMVLTDANFDQVLRSTSLPVLVDFWAEWCGPCRMVSPVVEQLSREYAGRALVAKVNVDENRRVQARYNVMSIPTLLIFRNGQVVDQIIGAQPAHILRQRLAQQVR